MGCGASKREPPEAEAQRAHPPGGDQPPQQQSPDPEPKGGTAEGAASEAQPQPAARGDLPPSQQPEGEASQSTSPKEEAGADEQALYAAAERGDEAEVSRLLSLPSIDPNHMDDSGYTPLVVAAGYGHGAVVRTLVELGQLAVVGHRGGHGLNRAELGRA